MALADAGAAPCDASGPDVVVVVLARLVANHTHPLPPPHLEPVTAERGALAEANLPLGRRPAAAFKWHKGGARRTNSAAHGARLRHAHMQRKAVPGSECAHF